MVGTALAGPVELLPDALLLTALVWLAIDTIEQRRVSRPRVQLITNERAAAIATTAALRVAGAAAAALLWGYERAARGDRGAVAAGPAALLAAPVRRWRASGPAAALVLLHAAVVWGAAGVCGCPRFCGDLASGAGISPRADCRVRRVPARC